MNSDEFDFRASVLRLIASRRLALCLAAAFLFMSSACAQTAGSETGIRVTGDTFIAIIVDDDSTSTEWYKHVFGLTQKRHITADDGSYSIRLLEGEKLNVEVIRLSNAAEPPNRHVGLFKAGFYVKDIDVAHVWLQEVGADVDDFVFTDEALNVRSFVFHDPDGNRLQAFERCGDRCGG